jgi:hypothetical protein
LTVVGPSVIVDFSNETNIERNNTIHRSALSSPSFPADFTEVGTAPTGVTTFTDSPPEFETTFTYRVTASVNGGRSDPSPPASITTSSEGQLSVSITGTNTPVETRSALTINVEVENTGDYRADKTLDVDLAPQ